MGMKSSATKQTVSAPYVVVQAALPGPVARIENIGILLFDFDSNQLYARFRRDFRELVGDEADWFEALAEDVAATSKQLGAHQYLDWLESTVSNALRISERESVLVDDYTKTLNRLYDKNIRASILPFRTHLPILGTVAAGEFKNGPQIDEPPENWVEVPPEVTLTGAMFVLQVEGDSMEPMIPDSSFCVFNKIGVDATVDGKPMLVEQEGDLGNLYALRLYRRSGDQDAARKPDDGWLHESFTLSSLNPAFKPVDYGPDCCRMRLVADHHFTIPLSGPLDASSEYSRS